MNTSEIGERLEGIEEELEEVKETTKPGSKMLRFLEVCVMIFAAVSGAASVVILVWKGGQLAHMVVDHEVRLNNIEMRGSPNLDTHTKVDAEYQRAVNSRLERLEKIFEVALDMRNEMSRLSQKVDDLKETIREGKKTP